MPAIVTRDPLSRIQSSPFIVFLRFASRWLRRLGRAIITGSYCCARTPSNPYVRTKPSPPPAINRATLSNHGGNRQKRFTGCDSENPQCSHVHP